MVNRLSDGRRYGHRMRSVWGGPEGEREFFALLESATRYVHIETFIVGGEIGVRLVELLVARGRSQAVGVPVVIEPGVVCGQHRNAPR